MSETGKERIVTCKGARLWTVETGSGVPFVLFNGGPGCDDYLGPVARLVDDVWLTHARQLGEALHAAVAWIGEE